MPTAPRHRITARHLPATAGDVRRAPVVGFVHGMADGAAAWTATMAALPHCDRWAFDFPWSGATGADWPGERTSAEWLAEAARRCPTPPDVWVGHSFGALALLDWQVAAGGADLVLVAPLFAAADQAFDAATVAAYVEDVPRLLAAMIAERAPRPVPAGLLAAMGAHVAGRLLPDGVAELFRLLAAVAEAPLGRLTGRVTVARGDADQPVNIASADRLAAALGTTVTVLAGCGHTPMLRDAAAVAALIDGALAPRLALAS